MAPTTRHLLMCAPPVLLAIACLVYKAVVLKSFNKPLNDDNSFTPGGVLMMLQPKAAWSAFKAAVNHPVGPFVVIELVLLAYVHILLGGFEACRAHAQNWYLATVLSLFALLPAFPGASAAFLLAWLPAYLLNRPNVWTASNGGFSSGRVTNWLRLLSIAFVANVSTLLNLARPKDLELYSWANTFPVQMFVVLLVYNVLHSSFWTPKTPAEASYTVWSVFFGATLASIVWRVVTMVLLFRDPSLPSQLLNILQKPSFSDTTEAAIFVFLMDLLSLTVLSAYFVWLEDGWTAALSQ